MAKKAKKNAAKKSPARKARGPMTPDARAARHPDGAVSITEAAARLMNARTGKIGMTHQRVRQLIRDKFLDAERNGHFFSVRTAAIDKFNGSRKDGPRRAPAAKRTAKKAGGAKKKAAPAAA